MKLHGRAIKRLNSTIKCHNCNKIKVDGFSSAKASRWNGFTTGQKCCFPSQQNTVKRRSCRAKQPASVSCNLSTPTRLKGYFTVGATVSHALRPPINISPAPPPPPPYNPRQGPSRSSPSLRRKPGGNPALIPRAGRVLFYNINQTGLEGASLGCHFPAKEDFNSSPLINSARSDWVSPQKAAWG